MYRLYNNSKSSTATVEVTQQLYRPHNDCIGHTTTYRPDQDSIGHNAKVKTKQQYRPYNNSIGHTTTV